MIDFNLFQRSIHLLKDRLLSDLADSLQVLYEHSEVLQKEHSSNAKKLKMLLLKFKIQQKKMSTRKETIVSNDIQPKIPLLKKSSTSSNVTKTIVAQIVEARKEIENIDLSLEELKLRLLEHTKKTKETHNAIKIGKERIRLLEAAIEIQGFFNMNNYKVDEIADYEFKRYFDLYKGAETDG